MSNPSKRMSLMARVMAATMGKMPKALQNHIIAGAGEFVGTFFFLFMAFAAAQIANENSSDAPKAETLMYISLAFGFSLMVNAWIFFRVSGGLFNPVVTLSLVLIKAITPVRGVVTFVAQLLASMSAAAVVDVLFPGHHKITTRLSEGTSISQGLFIEMFLTAQLLLAILFLAAEKHKSTYLAPIGIGLALFITQLAGIYYTGASLNPARSFGPDVAQRNFPGYHWIYWVGPALGAVLATAFYGLAKSLEFPNAVPGQDHDGSPERDCDEEKLRGNSSSSSDGMAVGDMV